MNDDNEELASGIRRLVEAELAPLLAGMGGLTDFTPEIIQAAAGAGLMGVRIAEEFGGQAMSLRQYCLIQREFARVNPVLSLLGSSTSGLAPMAIQRHGTDAQKHRHLPGLTQGKRTAFALTEPEAGSDAAAIRTRATKVEGGWRLDGMKHFITCADEADLLLVLAVTDGALRAKGGITAFLVERGTAGVEIGRVDRTFGSAAWTLAAFSLNDCFLPDEAVLGTVGGGFAIAMESLDEGRLNVASICLGASEALLALMVEQAKTRKTFGRQLSDNQAIQWMLADSVTDIAAMRALIEAALTAEEGERPLGTMASIAKLFASEAAGRIADRAVQIHGAGGLVEDSFVGRMYRDLRIFRIGEGASEIQRVLIARSLLR